MGFIDLFHTVRYFGILNGYLKNLSYSSSVYYVVYNFENEYPGPKPKYLYTLLSICIARSYYNNTILKIIQS